MEQKCKNKQRTEAGNLTGKKKTVLGEINEYILILGLLCIVRKPQNSSLEFPAPSNSQIFYVTSFFVSSFTARLSMS
jgi:hypothetical protein